jgi:hypothetical protein
MVFPVGSRLVRCTQCRSYTPTPAPLSYTCQCGLYVTYASTIATLICTVCYTVRPPPAPVTPTLAPLTPLGISPAAAAALHAPYATPALLPHFRGHGTIGVGASPYGLLPSTPILSSTGPRPAPIPRAAQRFSVPHSMAQYYATTAAPSAEAHSQQSSAAVASSEPTVEKSIGMEASPAEEGIQVTSEQQHQLWTAPQEIERARTPEEADLSAVDNHRNGDHGSQASSTARDSTRPDDNGHAGEPGDTG